MAEPVVRPPSEEEVVMPAPGQEPAKPVLQEAGPTSAAAGGPTTPTAAAARSAAGTSGAAPETRSGAVAPVRSLADRGLPPSVYWVLSLACLAMAAACLGVPGLTASAILRKSAADPLEFQHYSLLRLNGGALLVASAAAAALATGGWGAAGERGADVLKLALSGHGLTNTLLFAYYFRSIHRLMLPVELATNGAVAVLPALDLLTSGGHKGLLRELGRRFAPPRGGSLLAGAHYLLALLFPAVGAMLFYAPRFTLYHMYGYSYGASTFLLAKLAGVADKSLIPVAQLLLKDSAQGRTAASAASRLLNIGMLLSGVVHVAVLGPMVAKGEGGWVLPAATAGWAMALATSAARVLATARMDAEGAAAIEKED